MTTNHHRMALFAVLACGLALGIALGSETWGGLVPCALCLLERWPYRVAIGLAIVAGLMPRFPSRLLLTGVCLCMAAAVGLGVVHVGVEQGAWPSPLPECAAPRITGKTFAERLAQMPDHHSKPCDDPTYLVPFVPVSMAAMNLIWALAVGGGLAVVLWRGHSSRR